MEIEHIRKIITPGYFYLEHITTLGSLVQGIQGQSDISGSL